MAASGCLRRRAAAMSSSSCCCHGEKRSAIEASVCYGRRTSPGCLRRRVAAVSSARGVGLLEEEGSVFVHLLLP